MRPGTRLSCSPLRATKMTMIARGTAIDTIVRGWRRRRASESWSGVTSGSGPPVAGVAAGRGGGVGGMAGGAGGAVGDGHAGDTGRERELGRPGVAVAEHEAGVPALHPVDARGEGLEAPEGLALRERAPEAIERVRDPDQAALLPDGGDRLRRGQAGRDGARQEGRHEVAVAGPDLLPDDDGQAGGRGRAGLEGPLDRVVVGDREGGEAAPGGRRAPR